MQKKLVLRSQTADRYTDRHTEVLITGYPIRASSFQASASDMSGPIMTTVLLAKMTIYFILSDWSIINECCLGKQQISRNNKWFGLDKLQLLFGLAYNFIFPILQQTTICFAMVLYLTLHKCKIFILLFTRLIFIFITFLSVCTTG